MSQPGVVADHFPSTHRTWLQTRLDAIGESDGAAGGEASAAALDEVRQHLMTRYYEPLLAYARGSTMRTLESPEELVHGFFANTVTKRAFLSAWSVRGSSLRRWMMNGLILHARGIARDRARERQRAGEERSAALADLAAEGRSAERAFESVWAFAMLDEALQDARHSLAQRGRGDEFELFRSHVIDRRTYRQIHNELDIDPVRAASVVRGVMACVRESLRDRLRDECERGGDLDDEVRSILRQIDRS